MRFAWIDDVPEPFLGAFVIVLLGAAGWWAGDSPLYLGAALLANGLSLTWLSRLYIDPEPQAFSRRGEASGEIQTYKYARAKWISGTYPRALRACRVLGIASVAIGITLLGGAALLF